MDNFRRRVQGKKEIVPNAVLVSYKQVDTGHEMYNTPLKATITTGTYTAGSNGKVIIPITLYKVSEAAWYIPGSGNVVTVESQYFSEVAETVNAVFENYTGVITDTFTPSSSSFYPNLPRQTFMCRIDNNQYLQVKLERVYFDSNHDSWFTIGYHDEDESSALSFGTTYENKYKFNAQTVNGVFQVTVSL